MNLYEYFKIKYYYMVFLNALNYLCEGLTTPSSGDTCSTADNNSDALATVDTGTCDYETSNVSLDEFTIETDEPYYKCNDNAGEYVNDNCLPLISTSNAVPCFDNSVGTYPRAMLFCT